MREYLFHGKRVDNGEWVEGMPCSDLKGGVDSIQSNLGGGIFDIYPESFGQYTGMNEFVLTDESHNAKLFEGDIVEVWGWRSVRGRNQSQYDRRVKVRGVISFKHGEWCINYDNEYNKIITELKGAETQERDVYGSSRLYYYGYHSLNREEYRKQELVWHRKYHDNDADICHGSDIVKIGTVFENADLLEG